MLRSQQPTLHCVLSAATQYLLLSPSLSYGKIRWILVARILETTFPRFFSPNEITRDVRDVFLSPFWWPLTGSSWSLRLFTITICHWLHSYEADRTLAVAS